MSTKNQIIFLLFLQIFQLLKSDIIKRATLHQQQQQHYQQYLQSQQLTTTPKNPFITSPDNLLARYIVKEQEHLLETEGEKPSELWLEHQRRRFGVQIPTTNFITGSKNSFNNRSTLRLPIDNNNSNNKRQRIIKTELNNESAINKNIQNNDNNVFSYTKNIHKNFEIQNSESKESEESEEKFNTNDKIKNKNFQKNHQNNFNEKIQIDDKIMLVDSTVISHENSRENTREKFKLNRNEKINNKNKQENFHLKTPSFKNFLEFLKSVQNGLLTKATSGIQDKISRLKELRDTILMNIEDRFGQLWIDKSKNQKSKRALFDQDESEHNNFPSTETAMMTICFLTFAVFLIKLVLQVINTFKSRHFNFNGFTLNSNVEALRAINNRKNAKYFEEDEDDNIDDIAKIVSATEKYVEE